VPIVVACVLRRIRVIRASATGSFATLLPAPTDSCSSMTIRATGSSGDVAALALSKGLCPPPGASGASGTTTQPLPDPHGPASVNLG
jgi:hypothetical protein